MDSQKLVKYVLEKEEHDRQLVAYEIHDGIAQYISAAIMHLEAHKASLPENTKQNHNISESLRLLQEASRETQHLISGIRPPALDELGIIDSIEMLVADARLEINNIHFRHTLQKKTLANATRGISFSYFSGIAHQYSKAFQSKPSPCGFKSRRGRKNLIDYSG